MAKEYDTEGMTSMEIEKIAAGMPRDSAAVKDFVHNLIDLYMTAPEKAFRRSGDPKDLIPMSTFGHAVEAVVQAYALAALSRASEKAEQSREVNPTEAN